MDMNAVLVKNILDAMKEKNKKQIDLATDIGVSRQIMSKMLNGSRTINAVELSAISASLDVPMERLVKIPAKRGEANSIRAFMGNVNSEEARRGLQIADQLADLIVFHTKTFQNGTSMMNRLED